MKPLNNTHVHSWRVLTYLYIQANMSQLVQDTLPLFSLFCIHWESLCTFVSHLNHCLSHSKAMLVCKYFLTHCKHYIFIFHNITLRLSQSISMYYSNVVEGWGGLSQTSQGINTVFRSRSQEYQWTKSLIWVSADPSFSPSVPCIWHISPLLCVQRDAFQKYVFKCVSFDVLRKYMHSCNFIGHDDIFR